VLRFPGGNRGSELAAGADAELGEDLAQVVGDGGGADKQLRGDLRVGGALAGQAGDQRFLRGQGIGRLGGLLPGVPAGRPELGARPFGKRRGADRVEDLVRAAELIAGVAPAPLAALPLAVDQVGAGQVHPQPGTAEAVDRLAVQVAPSLTSARERASAPSIQSVPQARAMPQSRCRAPAARSGTPLRTAASTSSTSAQPMRNQ
jgi:hypothetical protein